MSFWTDAAILGDAGIPSVLFGPTGAGLHSLEEWVDVQSVLTCRDALVGVDARLVSLERVPIHDLAAVGRSSAFAEYALQDERRRWPAARRAGA